MLKKTFCLAWLLIILGTACDGGDSDGLDIPPGFDLLTSDCPAEDILEIPVSDGFFWECNPIGIVPTLSGVSEVIDCFSTVSKADAFCDIAVLDETTFMATRLEFDLDDPPDQPGCFSGCSHFRSGSRVHLSRA